MSGFLTAPAFAPPQPGPITIGPVGQVLTVVSSGVAAFAAAGSSGGVVLGGRLAYTSPAGAVNNVNPGGGFPANIGRLVTTLSADSNWTGLLAGTDGQLLWVINSDPTQTLGHSLTLNKLNTGSLAANRFMYQFDLVLGPNVSKLLCYDATLAKWQIA